MENSVIASNSIHRSRAWRAAALLCFIVVGANAPSARAGGADVITVGISGLGNNCTVPTIQAAIDEARRRGGPQDIWVTRDVADGVWTNQRLTITNQDVTIQGGFDDCFDVTPSDYTYLSGQGGSAAPVLKIRGSGVVNLRGIAIVQGDASGSGDAGGIDYQGRGVLTLGNVRVEGNSGSGHDTGGIDFEGSGGPAFLDLLDDVAIVANARIGLRVSGSATLTMHGERNFVWLNEQAGLYVAYPATASISAPSFDERGVFYQNGGPGIAAGTVGSGTGDAFVRVYARDPARPPAIVGNLGPAIVVNSLDDTTTTMTVCARNIRIADNVVSLNSLPGNDGNLISAEGAGAFVRWNTDCDLPPEANVTCPPQGQTLCNVVHGNVVSNGRALFGATRGGRIELARLRVTGNTTPALIQTTQLADEPNSSITARNSLFDNNDVRTIMVNVNSRGLFTADNLTFAANTGDFVSLRSNGPTFFSLTASIVDQTQPFLGEGGNPILTQIVDVMTPDLTGVRAGHRVLNARPTYLPGSHALAPNSPGIDVAAPLGGVDIDGRAREVDDPAVPNAEGPRDLGAYESQTVGSVDPMFKNGFE